MHPEVPICDPLRIRAEFVQSARSMVKGARPEPLCDGLRAALTGRGGLLARDKAWTLTSRVGVRMEVVSGSRVRALPDWGGGRARTEVVASAQAALLEGRRA
jgi:hypothetical protein